MTLYDRINTRSYSPIKCPPSDALERAKEVLAEIESWPDDMDPDAQELRDILCDPHFREKFDVIKQGSATWHVKCHCDYDAY
ncbi:uncharacterized protein NPIL_499251 [Nephila pilipes]|uniref:L27 domain-containing protein n=1 Tax=Nephila pilipes TaxID=299642 RepID=A0A8X6TZJ5_NEPPI|nr:uncharacterized protein NPIL_499251 [Nephila pilipes]